MKKGLAVILAGITIMSTACSTNKEKNNEDNSMGEGTPGAEADDNSSSADSDKVSGRNGGSDIIGGDTAGENSAYSGGSNAGSSAVGGMS